jgi:AP-1 complex subunit gamma-1
VDLFNDEAPAAAGSPPNGQPTTNEEFLTEIFGNSSSPNPPTVSSPMQTQKSTVEDILGLFGSSAPATVASPTQALPSNPASAFSLPQTQTPPASQPPVAPRLTSYSAYDNNELKVTLTPQTVVGRPGVINILARFQVVGMNPVTGLNFQAAVPKVTSGRSSVIEYHADGYPFYQVTTITNASYVQPSRESWCHRDTTDACGRTCRRKSPRDVLVYHKT